MSPSSSTGAGVLRVARGAALTGFAIGTAIAIEELTTSTWVREFQAGPESPFSERALAIAQRAAIEGLGFGLAGLLCGLLAALLTGLSPREPRAHRFAGHFLLAAAALFYWSWATWITDAALPFLGTGGLVLLNVAAYGSILLGMEAYAWLCARLPFAPRAAPAALAGSALLAFVAGTWVVNARVLQGDAAARTSPVEWALAGGTFVVGLPLAALLARLALPFTHRLARRLERGPLLPRAVGIAGEVAIAGCVLVSAFTLELTSVSGEATYPPLEAPGEPDGPNVVFITIDTLRADHLGCYGYERDTSPFIDSLAAEGALFLDPAAPAAWTKPSTGTILTGLHPSRHGALYHGSMLRLPQGERTLAEAFRDSGYATAGFVSNPNIKRVFEFDRGFDEFFDSPVEDTITLAAIRSSLFGGIVMELSRHQFNWKYENDIASMNRQVFAWLEANRDVPFFLYVHYIDPHIPYTPPPDYEAMFARDHEGFPVFNERKRLVGIDRYDGEIRYTDDGVKALAAKLSELGLAGNTLIAITSDHGEEFFEHEVLGHGFSLYQPVIRVPIVLNGPGVPPGRRIDSPVQVLDMPATVLDLAGTGITELGDGRSFAQAVRDESWTPDVEFFLENEYGQDISEQRTFVLNGIRVGRYKLVLTERNVFRPPWMARYGAQELYDLEADPQETRNLIHEERHRERIEDMLERLRAHSQFLSETGFRDIEPAALSPEVEAQLENLGYLGE